VLLLIWRPGSAVSDGETIRLCIAILSGSVTICRHGVTRLQSADGEEGFQIRRVAAYVLNKQW
jgi:hypothetical protein